MIFFNAINTDYHVVHFMPRNQIKILSEMEVAKPHNLLIENIAKGTTDPGVDYFDQ